MSTALARALIVSFASAGLTGCTGMETTPLPPIRLTIEDGARWIEPNERRGYWCDQGFLVCTGAGGRMTSRMCRCVDDGLDDPVAR